MVDFSVHKQTNDERVNVVEFALWLSPYAQKKILEKKQTRDASKRFHPTFTPLINTPQKETL
jgi:hypothetical protein